MIQIHINKLDSNFRIGKVNAVTSFISLKDLVPEGSNP
jgi:hypothetical protein